MAVFLKEQWLHSPVFNIPEIRWEILGLATGALFLRFCGFGGDSKDDAQAARERRVPEEAPIRRSPASYCRTHMRRDFRDRLQIPGQGSRL